MSAPVDVLAVMNAACCVLAMDKIADPQKQLEKATAAVAELIAAAREVDEVSEVEHSPSLDSTCEQCRAFGRLRAALARCGGAQ